MNEHQRQLTLLIGFMTLLAVVLLFLLVYSPDPVEPKGVDVPVPEPFATGIEVITTGWEQLLADFRKLDNLTDSSPPPET